VGEVCDNCVALSNPEQTDLDGDNVGDICPNDLSPCGDLVEENLLLRWSARRGTLSALEENVKKGDWAVRWEGEDQVELRYHLPQNQTMEISDRLSLEIFLRGNNSGPWFPMQFQLEDNQRNQLILTQTEAESFLDPTWRRLEIPLEGSPAWNLEEHGEMARDFLQSLSLIFQASGELQVELDGVSFLGASTCPETEEKVNGFTPSHSAPRPR